MARKTQVVKKFTPVSAKRRSVKDSPDALGVFIAAATEVLDLPVEKAWLPAIEANLRVTLQHAAAVNEFKLPDNSEPAPVFKV
jgi:hypothetical protein